MQGQEPDGLSLAVLRTTLAAASQWAFAADAVLRDGVGRAFHQRRRAGCAPEGDLEDFCGFGSEDVLCVPRRGRREYFARRADHLWVSSAV